MYLCYVDKAGCIGSLKSKTDSVQPLFVVLGLWLPAYGIDRCTREFIELKKRYFPDKSRPGKQWLDDILWEIKGADLRRDIREGRRSERRRAIGFLDDLVDLVAKSHGKLTARVYVKGVGVPINGTAVSTKSIQYLFTVFQDYLTSQNGRGLVVADSRSKAINVSVSHSIFTQRFKASGDEFNRVLELPFFANTDNHAGLQITDLVCSGLLFSIASYSYCLGHVENVHVSERYKQLKDRYGRRLQALQHRYKDENGRYRGGVTVVDGISKRSSAVMFR